MSLDLNALFRLDVSAVELFVRTSAVYLTLLTALRLTGRRTMGSLELPEMLMLVLIADGVQNGIAGEYRSITGALIVGGTIIGWNYLLTALAYHLPFARRLLHPEPLTLVADGRVRRDHMRRELLTEEELLSQLRTQGIEDPGQVKLACLEPDGELSVVRREDEDEASGGRRRRALAG